MTEVTLNIESNSKSEGYNRVPGVRLLPLRFLRYRTESEVKGLKEKFLRGRGTPNLTNINDINTVCGCLKDFLRGLKEPLVTYSLWHDFTNAAGRLGSLAVRMYS